MINNLIDYIKKQDFSLPVLIAILGITIGLLLTIIYFCVCLFSYNIDFWISYYKGYSIHISKWIILILYLLITSIKVNDKLIGSWLFWLSIVISYIMMVIVNE